MDRYEVQLIIPTSGQATWNKYNTRKEAEDGVREVREKLGRYYPDMKVRIVYRITEWEE